MSDININFSPINVKQKEFIESNKRFILLSGAVAAGKSICGCWKGFILNLKYPGNRGLICRKEFSSLKSSTIITLLEQVIPKEMIVSYDKINGVLVHKTTVPHVFSSISFSGLDKKADQQYPTKIGSTEYGWIFADETTELSKDDWEVLSSRLRYKISRPTFYKVKKYMGWKLSYEEFNDRMIRQLFGATNPDSPNHHLYKFFFESDDSERLKLLVTPYDNPTLDKNYLKMLETTLSGIRKERLLYGKWIQAEGVVYDCFDLEKNVFKLEITKELINYKTFFGSADSNFPLPRAGCIFGVKPNGCIDLIDEFYQEGAHPEDLGKWFNDWSEHFNVILDIYHDPSDPEAISKINAFPFLNCDKAKNAVIAGIDRVYEYTEKGLFRINETCINSIKQMQSYKWVKSGQPSKTENHLNDCHRYGIFTYDSLMINNQGNELESVPQFM